MATEETLITYSSEVGQSQFLVQMFFGRIPVAKEILVPNMNFVRLGTRELLCFFFVAVVKIFTIAMAIETVLATNSYCPN